jgi:ComF family protein
MEILKDLLQFFFPELCVACGQLLTSKEKVLCTSCFYHLPRTDFHKFSDNPVSQLFWGRVKIESATSWFYYFKGSAYQSLIHKLKYNGRKDIGIEMGKAFASEILSSSISDVDFLIPVPLHPRKLSKRGYNQSEIIASGISVIFNKEVLTDVLIRTSFTDTQTRKSRFDRFINMEGKFVVRDKSPIIHKHILLIDDIVTTGSTIESCVQALVEVQGVKVSVATLGVA